MTKNRRVRVPIRKLRYIDHVNQLLIFNQKRERDRSIQKEKEQPNKFIYLTTTPLQTETLRILSSFEIQILFVSYVDMENPMIFLGQIISRNTFEDIMILRNVNSQNQSPRKSYLSSLGYDGSLMKKGFATFQKSLLQCLTQTNKFVEITHSSPTFRTLSSV